MVCACVVEYIAILSTVSSLRVFMGISLYVHVPVPVRVVHPMFIHWLSNHASRRLVPLGML